MWDIIRSTDKTGTWITDSIKVFYQYTFMDLVTILWLHDIITLFFRKYILKYLGVKGDDVCNLPSNNSQKQTVYLYRYIHMYIHTYIRIHTHLHEREDQW